MHFYTKSSKSICYKWPVEGYEKLYGIALAVALILQSSGCFFSLIREVDLKLEDPNNIPEYFETPLKIQLHDGSIFVFESGASHSDGWIQGIGKIYGPGLQDQFSETFEQKRFLNNDIEKISLIYTDDVLSGISIERLHRLNPPPRILNHALEFRMLDGRIISLRRGGYITNEYIEGGGKEYFVVQKNQSPALSHMKIPLTNVVSIVSINESINKPKSIEISFFTGPVLLTLSILVAYVIGLN